MRKFLLEIGGWRYASEGITETSGSHETSGFGSARYTRSLSSSDLNDSWLREFVTKEVNCVDLTYRSLVAERMIGSEHNFAFSA